MFPTYPQIEKRKDAPTRLIADAPGFVVIVHQTFGGLVELYYLCRHIRNKI